jgi:hypothetical protein
MTHTDKDLLDLYKDLLDVGLAETPKEEAERLRTEARADYKQSLSPQIDITKWLLAKSYPHTYALVVRQNSITKLTVTTLFPVVRGYVICTSDTLTLPKFKDIFSPRVQSINYYSIYYYHDLKGLKQGILDLNKTYPTITPDKFTFLDIV